jgi:hypothetical protein
MMDKLRWMDGYCSTTKAYHTLPTGYTVTNFSLSEFFIKVFVLGLILQLLNESAVLLINIFFNQLTSSIKNMKLLK